MTEWLSLHFTSLGRLVNCVHVQLFVSPWTARHLVHGDSPGKNTGVGFHALLQGIVSTQGSNSGLPHCRCILYCLSHQESPRILKWVAYPFSRRSSWTWNQIKSTCFAGRIFTRWATWDKSTILQGKKKNCVDKCCPSFSSAENTYFAG